MDLPQERISRTKINSDLNALQAQGKTYLEAIIILKERYKREYQNVDEQIYNETYSFVNIFQDTESKFQRVPHTMAVHISRLTKELDIILDFVDFNKYSNALLKRVIDLGPAYLIPLLLNHGADSDMPDLNGVTAVDYAIRKNKFVELFLAKKKLI